MKVYLAVIDHGDSLDIIGVHETPAAAAAALGVPLARFKNAKLVRNCGLGQEPEYLEVRGAFGWGENRYIAPVALGQNIQGYF